MQARSMKLEEAALGPSPHVAFSQLRPLLDRASPVAGKRLPRAYVVDRACMELARV